MVGIRVSVIAAVAENGVIGAAGGMPWRLSADMKRFKRLTMGKPVVMGRKTFESIGKPLAGRINIVVSGKEGYAPDGVQVSPSLEAGLVAAVGVARAAGDEEVMVLGGGTVYAKALPVADRLYITHVEANPEGDTYFPAIDPSIWKATSAERTPAGPKDSAASTFVLYERIAAIAAS